MKFRCFNCNNGEFESDKEIVSEYGIDSDIKIPFGWQIRKFDTSVRFICPDCIAHGKVHEKMIELKDTPRMIEIGMFDDVNLINVRLHAKSIMEACERKLIENGVKDYDIFD